MFLDSQFNGNISGWNVSNVKKIEYINLSVPVAHIWYLKSLPSRLGLLIDMTLDYIERVLYFEAFLVTNPGSTPLAHKQLLTEEMYFDALDEYGEDEFEAKMGAEAIQDVFSKMQLEKEATNLREDSLNTKSQTKLKKYNNRLKLIDSLIQSGNKPEQMILERLPILPTDLRPLVSLDDVSFSTGNLNVLYNNIKKSNNRLVRLLELDAPEITVRNEKRMLQEAVDSLIKNEQELIRDNYSDNAQTFFSKFLYENGQKINRVNPPGDDKVAKKQAPMFRFIVKRGNIFHHIRFFIEQHGANANLNHINVSEENLYGVFKDTNFNGDISKWTIHENIDINTVFEGFMYTGIVKQKEGNGITTHFFNNGAHLPNTRYTEFYKSGNPSFEGEFNKDNEWHGLVTQWYENGQKQNEGNYKDGKGEGLTKWWHENGQKSAEANFKDGEYHGTRMRWDKEGNVTFSATYDIGESSDQNGLEKQYDDEGNLSHYIEYKGGVVVNERVEIKE